MAAHIYQMITLVSYPRSGNTFLRNVLFEVYGIPSRTYHLEAHGPDKGWEDAVVVKTHLLPGQLPVELRNRKVVYLLRDGRDALVSLAHHRKDIIAPESDFETNLMEAIYAAEGSHFGGWSKHVSAWLPHADLVIRFEDLIADPIAACNGLKDLLRMPEAKPEKLPHFEGLKFGVPEYGSGKYSHGGSLASHWFRKGLVNGWKEEMRPSMFRLFWHLHGETMEAVSYTPDGTPGANSGARITSSPRTLVIEANKLADHHTDGVKRYVRSLLEAAYRYPREQLKVEVLIGNEILDLESALAWEARKLSTWLKVISAFKPHALAMLPDGLYQWIALKIKRSMLAGRSNQTAFARHGYQQAVNCDALLLTLPQHYHFIEHISSQKYMVVVHDISHILYPEFHDAANVRMASLGMEWMHRQQVEAIAVSSSTKRDLDRHFGVRATRIWAGVDRSVFFPVYNKHLLQLVRRRYGLPSGKFLLSVSTLEPRKNLQGLIDAYASMDEGFRQNHPLVLAGKKGWKWNALVPSHCKGQIHFTGYVAEEHLPALYSLAQGFCYISWYEGFGLPVLEAMACACPVLLSNRASLPELGGEVALYCEPDSTEDIASGLRKLSAMDKEKVQAALMGQTWNFSWFQCWNRIADLACR